MERGSYARLCEQAYQDICSSLEQQKADLRATRGQASIVAALSGLSGTLLSRLVLERMNSDGTGSSSIDSTAWVLFDVPLPIFLAVSCFLGSIIFSLRILLPNPGWQFDGSPKKLFKKFGSKGIGFSEDDLLRTMALAKEKWFDANEKLLHRVQSELFFAASLSLAQAMFWIVAFVAGG